MFRGNFCGSTRSSFDKSAGQLFPKYGYKSSTVGCSFGNKPRYRHRWYYASNGASNSLTHFLPEIIFSSRSEKQFTDLPTLGLVRSLSVSGAFPGKNKTKKTRQPETNGEIKRNRGKVSLVEISRHPVSSARGLFSHNGRAPLDPGMRGAMFVAKRSHCGLVTAYVVRRWWSILGERC